jgi:hypothetical protein
VGRLGTITISCPHPQAAKRTSIRTLCSDMTDRPFKHAIDTLRFCQAALDRSLPAKERRVLLRVHRWALARLEPLERSHAARVTRIQTVNQRKRVGADQATRELAAVESLVGQYRANLHGRFSRAGALRWIVPKSQIPKKRLRRYLKIVIPHGRGDTVSQARTGHT